MVGTGHGKTYTMTWSEPTEVALHFVTGSSASGTGEFQAWLDVEESGGAPDHLREKSQPARHGTLWFKAKPGVAYAIALAGYDAHDQGPYALTVSPPPSSEVLPASIAKPEPQTEEERVTDEQASAIASTAREGYSLVGKPFRGSLENVSKQEIAVRRGQCYRAVITLGKEARHAQTKTTPMLTLAARADRVVTFSSSKYNGGGNARVLLSTDVCPSANGTVKIEWIDEAKSPVKNAGSGTFVLEILARPIAESALKARDLAAASGW